MSTQFTLDVRQAAELACAFERNNWTAVDVKRLCDGDMLERLLLGIRREAEILLVKPIVDLDHVPFCEDGFVIHRHRKMGVLEWDPQKISLFASERQRAKPWVKGEVLHEEITSQNVYNANLLDFLLAHPSLIPEDWKGEQVHFWGTIYRATSFRTLCVRCIRYNRGVWRHVYHWLSMKWKDSDPAAVHP